MLLGYISPPDRQPVLFADEIQMALGATIGIGIGVAVGRMIFDDAVIGITFGASLGAAVGAFVAR